jgi:hypothetical protein
MEIEKMRRCNARLMRPRVRQETQVIRACITLILKPSLELSLRGYVKKYKRLTLHEETDSSQLFMHIVSWLHLL